MEDRDFSKSCDSGSRRVPLHSGLRETIAPPSSSLPGSVRDCHVPELLQDNRLGLFPVNLVSQRWSTLQGFHGPDADDRTQANAQRSGTHHVYLMFTRRAAARRPALPPVTPLTPASVEPVALSVHQSSETRFCAPSVERFPCSPRLRICSALETLRAFRLFV